MHTSPSLRDPSVKNTEWCVRTALSTRGSVPMGRAPRGASWARPCSMRNWLMGYGAVLIMAVGASCATVLVLDSSLWTLRVFHRNCGAATEPWVPICSRCSTDLLRGVGLGGPVPDLGCQKSSEVSWSCSPPPSSEGSCCLFPMTALSPVQNAGICQDVLSFPAMEAALFLPCSREGVGLSQPSCAQALSGLLTLAVLGSTGDGYFRGHAAE